MKHLLLFLALAGCAAAPTGGPAPSPVVSHGGAVKDQVSLIDALRQKGATVEIAPDPVEQPFFSVAGTSVVVNDAPVQVYEYANENEAAAQAAKISPDGYEIGGTTMVTWIEPPHFFRTGRIIVLYVGTDEKTLALLTELLGAQFAGGTAKR